MFNPNKYETDLEKLVYFKWTPKEIIVITKKEGCKFSASKANLAEPKNTYNILFDLSEEDSELKNVVTIAESKLNCLYTPVGMRFLSNLILSKALKFDFTKYDKEFEYEGNSKMAHVEVFDQHLNFAIGGHSFYFVVQSHGYYHFFEPKIYTVKKLDFNGFLRDGEYRNFHLYKDKSVLYDPQFKGHINTITYNFYQQKLNKDRINKAIMVNKEYFLNRKKTGFTLEDGYKEFESYISDMKEFSNLFHFKTGIDGFKSIVACHVSSEKINKTLVVCVDSRRDYFQYLFDVQPSDLNHVETFFEDKNHYGDTHPAGCSDFEYTGEESDCEVRLAMKLREFAEKKMSVSPNDSSDDLESNSTGSKLKFSDKLDEIPQNQTILITGTHQGWVDDDAYRFSKICYRVNDDLLDYDDGDVLNIPLLSMNIRWVLIDDPV